MNMNTTNNVRSYFGSLAVEIPWIKLEISDEFMDKNQSELFKEAF